MWIYQGQEYNPSCEELKESGYIGFVYIITEDSTEMKYVGKKLFWRKVKRPPLKGKKRKRIDIVESDWRSYYGSSVQVQQIVEERGESAYTREILRFCKTKGECSYYEAKEQFDRDVLLRDDYYNGIINCRINSKHLSKYK